MTEAQARIAAGPQVVPAPPVAPPPLRLPEQVVNAVEQAPQFANPELLVWIRARLDEGRAPYAIVQQLVHDGRPVEIATLLVGLTAKRLAVSPAGYLGTSPEKPKASDPSTHADAHTLDAEGSSVRTLLSIGKGGLEFALYDGLVTDAEIDFLKQASEPKMARSTVLAANFGNQQSEVRTSDGAFLDPHPAELAALERRIAALTGIPVDHGEAWQILHYRNAQEYRPHYDYFEPKTDQERQMMARSGNRVGTMIFYLSDVERGGATYFPKLDIAVHPRRGLAMWFGYMREGLLDERSQHAGMPIITGEKWIATKWLREHVFVS
ncbi:MAG TPA: 2OG-Fe(II) oxygenase [Rhodanobacteraceae bacterium]|nr:2OG-Fe(II) oxygenase [Rhodanobacteraceae bacterium]